VERLRNLSGAIHRNITFTEALHEELALCTMCDELAEWLVEISTPGPTLATAGDAVLLPLCTIHAAPCWEDITPDNVAEISKHEAALRELAQKAADECPF